MSVQTDARLPDGFTVRLHDDVVVGRNLSRGGQLLRCAPAVHQELRDRTVVVRDDLSSAVAARLMALDLALPDLTGGGPYGIEDVTVVIPVRDGTEGVASLLASLDGGVPSIVVDDASREPRALADVARRHGAELVRLDRNVGPAAARNVGLGRVATPLVAFLDADVHVTSADLTPLLTHFADPGLAAVAPRIRADGGQRWFQRYERSQGGLDLGGAPATVRTWSAVAYVPSACLVARVDSLGTGFDEELRSGEDVDLVWRLLASGHRVRYDPSVVVRHDNRSRAAAWCERQFFYGTSAAPLAQRHGVLVAPAVLTLPQAALLVALGLARGRGHAITTVLALLVASQAWRTSVGHGVVVRVGIVVSVLRTTARQGVGLVVHHAAPLSLLAALLSRRARPLVLGIGVAEALHAWSRGDRTLDPVRFTAARRLSTGAYGFGAWWGVIRTREWRAVLPHVVRGSRSS